MRLGYQPNMGNQPSTTVVESGTSGSNRKPPGPKPGVLPTAPLPVVLFIQSERSDFAPAISSSPNWRDNQTSLRSDVSARRPTCGRCRFEPISLPCSAIYLGEYPASIDERSVLCRSVRVPFKQWTGRHSNPRLLGFNQVLDRLSYQSVVVIWGRSFFSMSTKKARRRCDTGLCVIRKSTAECHKRNGCDGSIIFACS